MTDQNTLLSTNTHTLSDGRTLAYTSGGDPDGFPVVAHHGTPGSRLFAAVLSEAASEQGVKLIVPDRPGYGRSSSPPSDWTWGDWQEDLTELLDAASIDRAAVVGFSGGGPFALAAANSDWASRLGLVSTVVPPAENGLATLSKIPFALRILFGLSGVLASVRGPEAVVGQYTDRSVSEPVSRAIADDFQEALQQGSAAVARENRSFTKDSFESAESSVPMHAWHGSEDENTPLTPVSELVEASDGTLATSETDHLGTLLDCQRDVFEWLTADRET